MYGSIHFCILSKRAIDCFFFPRADDPRENIDVHAAVDFLLRPLVKAVARAPERRHFAV